MARPPAPRIYKPHGLTGPLSKRIADGLAQGKFTATEQTIAVAMQADWYLTALAPAARLVEHAGCDKAAVSRFVRRLGYAGHFALQEAAREEIKPQDTQEHPETDGAEDGQSSWLLHEIAQLENDAKAFILNAQGRDLEETADQIQVTASRLSRATRILIAAATTGATQWVPIVQGLFASAMTAEVNEVDADTTLAAKSGNFLVILHAGPSSHFSAKAMGDKDLYDGKTANIDGVHAVHLVVDGAEPAGSYNHRVLHLHDGADRLAGLSMLINTCIILIREATKREPSKAR